MSEEQEPPVAGAAPTATTTPVAPEPKRRRRWLVAAALLLAAGVAALLLLLRRGGPDTEAFRVRSEEVLGSLRDGKAEEVYEGASFRFKQTLLVDKFVDLVDRMNRTMGRFERVIDVVDVDQAVTVAGMTARVELELEYEKAETTGELSFHRGDDGAWRLLGLSVRIPEELEETAASLERQVERVRAPEEVIEQFKAILDDVRAGKVAEIHARAAPSFRDSRSVDEFRATLEAHRAEMGELVRLLAVISSAQNADKDRARVHALLQYERAKTTGTFEFMRVAGEWRMYGFKVVVPEPFLPPPTADGGVLGEPAPVDEPPASGEPAP